MSLTVYLSYQSSLKENLRKTSVYVSFNTSHTLRDISHAWPSSWYGMDRHDQHGLAGRAPFLQQKAENGIYVEKDHLADYPFNQTCF